MINIYKNLIKHKPRIKFGCSFRNCRNAVILAPHPDDETIGCGGTIVNLISAGISVHVILFTSSFESNIDRIEEFKRALKELGVINFTILNFSDSKLIESLDNLIVKLSDILDVVNPNLIFSPYLFDYNNDHIAVVQSLASSLKKNPSVKIYMYEIWTPILYPNIYFDITCAIEQKRRASLHYKSQQQIYGTIQQFNHLNRFRATMIHTKGFEYVEAFLEFNALEFMDIVGQLMIHKHWNRKI